MRERIGKVLNGLQRLRIAVLGDFALDAYWYLDPGISETSLETGHPVHQVQTQTYTPGGAANVATNLRSLGVGQVHAVGLPGDDLFGTHLTDLLRQAGVQVDHFRPRQAGWQTAVFAKPHRDGIEGSRIDFGAFNELSRSVAQELAATTVALSQTCDAIILNQQLAKGILTADLVSHLQARLAGDACPIIVDSRDRPGSIPFGVLKINESEARRRSGREDSDLASLVAVLQAERQAAVFVTRGEHGMLCADGAAIHDLPGHPQSGPIDPVGAGDTAVAAIAAALASGAEPLVAAHFANAAAAVTVGKTGTTGTASPSEVLELLAGPG